MLGVFALYSALYGAEQGNTSSSTIKIVSAAGSAADSMSGRLAPEYLGLICVGVFIAILIALRYLVTRYRLSLKAKVIVLLAGVFSLFLIFSLLSAFSISSLRSLSKNLAEISHTKLPIISYYTQINGLQTEQKVYFERYLRTHADADRQGVFSFDARIKAVIKSAEGYVGEAIARVPQQAQQDFLNRLTRDLGEIRQTHQSVVDGCAALFTSISSGSNIELNALNENFSTCTTATEVLGNMVIESLTKVQNEVDTSTQQALSAEQFSIEIIVAIALFSLAWGIFVMVAIWRSSMLVLKQINATILSLHQSSQDVGKASDNLIVNSSTLEETAHTQTVTVNVATASVARNEEIVSKNLLRVANSNELSQKINDIAAKAETSMNSLIDSMNKITESNDRIQQLVAIIEEIGEKTKIIDEIVFQTKLLSFNTSVEAERAGEHGRGFAVIAQEVGKLAQMSGSASKEISHMVTQTKDTAQVIARENRERVKNGNQLVQETGGILKEISNSSHSVIASAGEIMQTSKEQQVAITQLTAALSQIDKATNQNLDMAQRTAAASASLNQQSKSLNALVENLLNVISVTK
jgi:hypothetical protein